MINTLQSLRRELDSFDVILPKCNTILLVDDEPSNLSVLEALLEDDYRVLTADSGTGALEVLRAHPEIDMVITDQRMPEMSGSELLVVVAQEAPNTIRMVLTGYSDVEPIIKSINDGDVYRFLLKPWVAAEMRQTVADALALKAHRQAYKSVVSAYENKKAELQNTLKQLQETQDQVVMAERISTLGRFTAGIIHDIRNNLSVMMHMVEVVKTETQDQSLLDAADNALRTLQAIISLVRDVNAFAKRQHQKDDRRVDRCEVVTDAFLRETLQFLRLEMGDLLPTIKVDVGQGTERLWIDPQVFRQAVLALLRQAIRATSAHQVITIQSKRINDHEAEVTVTDPGIGSGFSDLQAAMLPSMRLGHAETVGLGFEIAKLVAVDHGGRLEVHNQPNKGSTAAITIGQAFVPPH